MASVLRSNRKRFEESVEKTPARRESRPNLKVSGRLPLKRKARKKGKK